MSLTNVSSTTRYFILKAQNSLLEEELDELKQERDAFRHELVYYREKAAKYISLAEERGVALKDLERQMERLQTLARVDASSSRSVTDEISKDPKPQDEIRSTVPGQDFTLESQPPMLTKEPIVIDSETNTDECGVKVETMELPSDYASFNSKRSRDIESGHESDNLPIKRRRSRRSEHLLVPRTDDNAIDTASATVRPSQEPSLRLLSQTSTHNLPSPHSSSQTETGASLPLDNIPQNTHTPLEPQIIPEPNGKTFKSITSKASTISPDPSTQADKNPGVQVPVVDLVNSSTPPPTSRSQLTETNSPSFSITPTPKWTSCHLNVNSSSIRRFLGGLTGPGATFTLNKDGRTHLFLQHDNCPILPFPGDPAIFYVDTSSYSGPDARVFAHRGSVNRETVWEYVGEYHCFLKPIDPIEFKKREPARFREDFVQKILFEEEFQENYVNFQYTPKAKRLKNADIQTRDSEWNAIERGEKTIFIVSIKCYDYDHDFAGKLVRRCTSRADSLAGSEK